MSDTNNSRSMQADFSLKQILPILLAVASGMFLVILDSTIMMGALVLSLFFNFQTKEMFIHDNK